MHTKSTALVAAALMVLGCGGAKKADTDGGPDGVDAPVDTMDVPVDTTDVPPDTSDPVDDSGCPPGTGDCDGNPGNGCETDLTSDDSNCGACGHDCEGGTCSSGACQPVHVADPVLGTSTGPWNGFLAVGPTYVYFAYAATPTGGVAMAAKDGSSSSCIECDVGEPRQIVTDGTHVYWTNPTINELRRSPVGTASPATVISSGSVGSPLAVDSSHVYWWNNSSNEIMQANLDGSSPSTVATGQNNVNCMAASSGHLFWTTDTAVVEIDLSSGGPTALASGLSHARSVAADATHVYYATGDWGAANTLERIPRGGTTPEVLANESVYKIVLDATHVYVADGHDNRIWRVSKSGGTVEVLATTGSSYPFDIDLDADCVYWTSEMDGGVTKVAK